MIREKRDYKNSYEADLPEQEDWAGEKFWDISLCCDTQKRTKLDNLICANSLINRPNRGMKNGAEPPTNAIHIYMLRCISGMQLHNVNKPLCSVIHDWVNTIPY